MTQNTDIIDTALVDLIEAEKRVTTERVKTGDVSEDTHADFERAVMSTRRRLLPYAEDVEDLWEQASIDKIPEICAKKVSEEPGPNRFGIDRGTETKVQHAPIEMLDAWSDALVKIANEVEA